MTETQLQQLINKYLTHSITEQERQDLFRLISLPQHIAELENIIDQQLQTAEFTIQEDDALRQLIFSRIQQQKSKQAPVIKMRPWKKWVAAASIVLAVVAYFVITRTGGSKQSPEIVTTDVPAPTSTKATITLADGRTISLDSLTTISQDNVTVIKNANGEIIYTGKADEVVYNTLFNPRGSKVVSLTLSDGTQVWLNSESSLKYPIAFTGNTRNVEITGEAYFEVAQSVTASGTKQSFIVTGNSATTEVLGTHFNINTYSDESNIKITLLEGSVRVTAPSPLGEGKGEAILKPGQQARVVNSKLSILNGVDVDEVMAWKNGRFIFGGSNVETVMRQIARWYDVEIVYEGEKPVANFRGTISRQENITQVLKMLELTEAVKFKIEGRKVIVTK